jgi:RNA polymerase II subunit A small phosphatase-like protein
MTTVFDKLLVLDLDETLVHTWELADLNGHARTRSPDLVLEDSLRSFKRPGVEEFLAWCFVKFKAVGLWTAGTLPYALELLPHLCELDRFAFVWGRERCTYRRDMETQENYLLKDIGKLRRFGFSRAQILCVDDTPENFSRSYGNYIPVRGFNGDPEDRELEQLRRYLETLGTVPDVRSIEKRRWQKHL